MRFYEIQQIADALQIPRKEVVADSFNAKCPFCNHRKYLLNCNVKKNIYRCNYCGTKGGAIDLYTRVTRGVSYDKSMRDEIIPELDKLLGLAPDSSYKTHRVKPNGAAPEVPGTNYPELSDEKLHALHARLLDIPFLALNQEDTDALKARGLSETVIARNGYRSFCTEAAAKYIPEDWYQRYRDEKWWSIQERNSVLKKFTKRQLLVSLALGSYLCNEDKNLTPEGMAGAFRFETPCGNLWGVRIYDGILIPIRNWKGQIVALQVRTKRTKGSKYMLLSSRGMPGGRIGRTRVHFPLDDLWGARAEADSALLTEGPLKADVYAHLDPTSPHVVMALVGVQTTSLLLRELRGRRIHYVFEAFDMDKLLKMPVMSAARKIRMLCQENGIGFSNLFWDIPSVEAFAKVYMRIGASIGVELPPKIRSSQILTLAYLTQELSRQEVSLPDMKKDWTSQSKGIDDYVYTQSRIGMDNA